MITRVMAQNPALLTRGTTQSDTIARVLSVEIFIFHILCSLVVLAQQLLAPEP